nr:2-C-methyl-D-erythritol 2,4-cyclodiphosphate synthase [Armatimonadota bacterium]
GERLGHNEPKAFVLLAGAPLLAWTLACMEACRAITEVIVVTPSADMERTWRLAVQFGFSKIARVVPGGPDRQSSVLNGLEVVSPHSSVALVHDAARPLTPVEVMQRCAAAAAEYGSASAAIPVVDTLRHGRLNEVAGPVVDRSALVRIQTPQAVRMDLIRPHLEQYRAIASQCTDDSSMVEQVTGVGAYLVAGSEYSLKITSVEDLAIAEALVATGIGTSPRGIAPQVDSDYGRNSSICVGFGYDVHSFDPARKMMLGGVHIPNSPGLSGHSDADVALHAVCDALLGAIGERDIGYHFPNTGEEWAGADSGHFLSRVVDLAAELGWAPLQVDVTVVAEQPRLTPHVEAMRLRIAEILGVRSTQVAIKATTNERMGFIGRGEGIASFALATLQRRS